MLDERRNRRTLIQRIRLLCGCGTGLNAVASNLCEALRTLLNADAGMLAWMSDDGRVHGFCQDHASSKDKRPTIARIAAMLLMAEGLEIQQFLSASGPLVGQFFDTSKRDVILPKDIGRHLRKQLINHHILDMRVHSPSYGVAGFLAWNAPDRPFARSHLETLEQVQPLLAGAFTNAQPQAQWRSDSRGLPHLIVDDEGKRLLAIDHAAQELLKKCNLLNPAPARVGATPIAPAFAAMMAERLRDDDFADAYLQVVDGRLFCRAVRTNLTQQHGGDRPSILITIDFQVAENLQRIEHVMRLPLTPLQREIALHGMEGGERRDALQRFAISEESLKKHVRTILAETGVTHWRDLRNLV